MFEGHPGTTKNTAVVLAWALAAVATGTGWKVWNDTKLDSDAFDRANAGTSNATDPKASVNEQSHIDYLLAAAILVTVGLALTTGIATDYAFDMFNLSRFHIHGLALAWGCLLAATAIWWWVYDTNKVARNSQSDGNYNDYFLTAASTSLIAMVFLTGAVALEMNVKVPLVDKLDKSMMKEERRSSKKSPGRERSMKKKSSPRRK